MTIPQHSRRLILTSIGYIGIVTFWVGPEDSIWAAAVLGAIGAMLGMLNLITQHWGGRNLNTRNWLLLTTLGGGLTGLAASGVTALLMTIKTAIHAHGSFTDYPLQVVLGILRRAPLWSAGGLLFGLALGMLTLALQSQKSR